MKSEETRNRLRSGLRGPRVGPRGVGWGCRSACRVGRPVACCHGCAAAGRSVGALGMFEGVPAGGASGARPGEASDVRVTLSLASDGRCMRSIRTRRERTVRPRRLRERPPTLFAQRVLPPRAGLSILRSSMSGLCPTCGCCSTTCAGARRGRWPPALRGLHGAGRGYGARDGRPRTDGEGAHRRLGNAPACSPRANCPRVRRSRTSLR